MTEAFICSYVRIPIGSYAGALSSIRADDLAAVPLKVLMDRHTGLDWEAVSDVILGCANQAGEDKRNIDYMALILAGLPDTVKDTTINCLCGSGLDALATAARAIPSGEAETGFSRQTEIHDTTIGSRFVNQMMRQLHGTDSMPETDENVAQQFKVSREDQDAFAQRSQQKVAAAIASGRLAQEIVPVPIPRRKSDPLLVETDEHPRPEITLEGVAKLLTPFRKGGTVRAGNASGVNDGAAALTAASEAAAARHGLTPLARILGGATAGVPPHIMGFGPAPATSRLCERLGLSPSTFDVTELNEASASQGLATSRDLGIADDERVNLNSGTDALGDPLGMSGAHGQYCCAGTPTQGSQPSARCHVHRRGPRHRARHGADMSMMSRQASSTSGCPQTTDRRATRPVQTASPRFSPAACGLSAIERIAS